MNSETLPIITTPRVVLRWISEDDVDNLYEIFSDPQVMRYWSSTPLGIGVTNAKWTDSHGQAHFDVKPNYGKIFVSGSTEYEGYLKRTITVSI